MANLKDVAELAGVTVTTVSRMINGRCNVSNKTREKIENAMRALDYHPNEFARSLAKKSSNIIGLIVPSASNYFFASVVQSVEAHAAAHGLKLLLCVSNLDAQKEKEYYGMLVANKVMGIILANLTQNLDDIVDLGSSLVVIERSPSPLIPSALTDNYYGGYLAAEHLIAKGCRKLLYVGGNVTLNTDPNRRFDGFSDACRKLGVDPPEQIEATWEEFITLRYDGTIEALFERYPHVDGILASNDVIAAGIIRHCLKRGIRVPQEMKVVGYDDTTFASNCIVPLTTIHQPIDEICRFAVESIVHRSAGEVVPVSTVFPVRLVERCST